MTPEQLKLFFDVNGIFIVFVWGILVKYLPALKKVPNSLIGWSGAIIYCLSKLLGPSVAHAAGFDIGAVAPDVAGVLIGGFTSCAWARGLFEGFGRPLLTYIFRKKGANAAS